MASLPDLVVNSKLETIFLAADQVRHTRPVLGQTVRNRQLKAEEIWCRKTSLGQGAYGTVWLEECVEGGERFSLRAVKEIKKNRLPVTYLQRELEATVKFSHANYAHCFVQSSGWFENDSSVFIAMEYMEYGDLQGHLHECLPEVEARQIAVQITEGLVFMHQSGFVHRDLKPSNILILQPRPRWWVKLADFGISKRIGSQRAPATLQIGTLQFMAPELLHIERDEPDETARGFCYTAAQDMWALGQIVFRMLTHEPAFPGAELAKYVLRDGPFPTHSLQRHGCTFECVDFLQLSMAPSPRGRISAEAALRHPWLARHEFIDKEETRVEPNESLPHDSGVRTAVQDYMGSWTTSTFTTSNSIHELPTEPIQQGTAAMSSSTIFHELPTESQHWTPEVVSHERIVPEPSIPSNQWAAFAARDETLPREPMESSHQSAVAVTTDKVAAQQLAEWTTAIIEKPVSRPRVHSSAPRFDPLFAGYSAAFLRLPSIRRSISANGLNVQGMCSDASPEDTVSTADGESGRGNEASTPDAPDVVSNQNGTTAGVLRSRSERRAKEVSSPNGEVRIGEFAFLVQDADMLSKKTLRSSNDAVNHAYAADIIQPLESGKQAAAVPSAISPESLTARSTESASSVPALSHGGLPPYEPHMPSSVGPFVAPTRLPDAQAHDRGGLLLDPTSASQLWSENTPGGAGAPTSTRGLQRPRSCSALATSTAQPESNTASWNSYSKRIFTAVSPPSLSETQNKVINVPPSQICRYYNCGATFNTPAALNWHVTKHHGGPRNGDLISTTSFALKNLVSAIDQSLDDW